MASSPVKFVKPAELFQMRRAKRQEYKFDITSQSPLKCLMDPSPIKNVPDLLKNPFKGKGVKRRLSMDTTSCTSSSSSMPPLVQQRQRQAACSGKRPCSDDSPSPRKPAKMTKFGVRDRLEMDEDANMELPHLNSNGASYCDSDYDDDDLDQEGEDASMILESLGLDVSQQDFPSLGKFK